MTEMTAAEQIAVCDAPLGIHGCVREPGHPGLHACDNECDLDHLREEDVTVIEAGFDPIQQPARVVVGHCAQCSSLLVVHNDYEAWPPMRCRCGWVGVLSELRNSCRMERGGHVSIGQDPGEALRACAALANTLRSLDDLSRRLQELRPAHLGALAALKEVRRRVWDWDGPLTPGRLLQFVDDVADEWGGFEDE